MRPRGATLYSQSKEYKTAGGGGGGGGGAGHGSSKEDNDKLRKLEAELSVERQKNAAWEQKQRASTPKAIAPAAEEDPVPCSSVQELDLQIKGLEEEV